MKIGVMFGNPETTTGGNALKFYASVRLDIRRIGSVKKGEEVIGNETRVKVVKNTRSRHRSAKPNLRFCTAKAFPFWANLVDLGVNYGFHSKIWIVVRLRQRQNRPRQGQRQGLSKRKPKSRQGN